MSPVSKRPDQKEPILMFLLKAIAIFLALAALGHCLAKINQQAHKYNFKTISNEK